MRANIASRPCRGLAWASILVLSLGAGILRGQDSGQEQDFVASPAAALHGFQIYSISAYTVYYSSGFPDGVGFQPTQGNTFNSDMGLGGSTQLGWTRKREKSDISIFYTPSYTGRVRYAAWNSLNHSLSINASRKLGRWTAEFAASGNLSNLAETFFSPTVFGNLAAAPGTFTDLAAAMVSGTYNNSQLASILTGAPLVESPGRNLFYGERMFMAAARLSLSYAFSPRLSLSVVAHGDRSQHVFDQQAGASSQGSFLIPRTTSVGADVSLSYSLTPRTQIGVSAGSDRIVSSYQDSYITTSQATFGRTMGVHWFMQAHGGLSELTPVLTPVVPVTGTLGSQLPSGPQPIGGGSLGYKTLSQTFLGAFDHVASDSYGYGASSTESVSASWLWKRPGRNWWLESSFSRQELKGKTVGSLGSWRATGGWGRTLNLQTTLLVEYAYVSYFGEAQNVSYSAGQSAVRVSLVWNPRPMVH